MGLPGAEPEGRAVYNTELQISLHASDNDKPVTDTELPKLRAHYYMVVYCVTAAKCVKIILFILF